MSQYWPALESLVQIRLVAGNQRVVPSPVPDRRSHSERACWLPGRVRGEAPRDGAPVRLKCGRDNQHRGVWCGPHTRWVAYRVTAVIATAPHTLPFMLVFPSGFPVKILCTFWFRSCVLLILSISSLWICHPNKVLWRLRIVQVPSSPLSVCYIGSVPSTLYWHKTVAVTRTVH